MTRNETECLPSGHELEQLAPKGVKDIRKKFEQGNSSSTTNNYKTVRDKSNPPAVSNPSTLRSSLNLPRNAPKRPPKPDGIRGEPINGSVGDLTSLRSPPLPPRPPSGPPPPPPSSPPSRPPSASLPSLPRLSLSLSDQLRTSDVRLPSISSPGSEDAARELESNKRQPPSRFNGFFKSGPLCTKCTKINFSQFYPNTTTPNQNGEQYCIELKHLLKKRKTCGFCRLLFQALCLPENDPLHEGNLQKIIQEDNSFSVRDGRVDFETWALVRENKWSMKNNAFLMNKDSRWPFGGHTNDYLKIHAEKSTRKEIKKNKKKNSALGQSQAETDSDSDHEIDINRSVNISTNAEFQESDDLNVNAVLAGEGAKKVLRVAEEFDDNPERKRWFKFVREMIPDTAFFTEMEKKKVPAALLIIVYGASHEHFGVMEVTLFGCSKRITRDVKPLSHFRLRIASPEVHTKEQSLRYGKILNKIKIDLELCRRWVGHCRDEHGDKCNKPEWAKTLQRPTRTGFRLVDVWDRAIVEPNTKTTHYNYTALSYVWGDKKHSQHMKRLISTKRFELFKPNSLDDKSVGNVIADAMEITRKLGLRYLWVDWLCILQDQEKDKQEQLKQMDQIYGSAVVTIVAASGRHPGEPIVGVTTERSINQLATQVTADPEINVLVRCKRSTGLRPWSIRAWTLQEKLSSKRLLVFHDGMVDFCCPCGVSYEDMAADDSCISKPPPLVRWLTLVDQKLASSTTPGMRLLRSPVFAQYAALIEQYAPRHLSTPSDALNAVSGMLRILITNQQNSQPRTPPLSGLPEEFLDQALHWHPAAGEDVRLKLRVTSNDSGKTGVMFPSWSWAAWTAVEEAVEEDAEGGNGGVRYEAPFRAQTDDNGKLKKVVPDKQDKAEEFMRPLMRWYVAKRTFPSQTHPQTHPRLRPLNTTGLGLALDDVDTEKWNELVSAATGKLDHSMPVLDQGVARLLTDQHLVFRTKIAQFRLGETHTMTDTTWKRDDSGKLVVFSEVKTRETPILGILDSKGLWGEVGRAWLPDPDGHTPGQLLYDYALISEAQYFGNDEFVDFTDYPLFNVMLLSWEGGRRPFARRVTMGRLTKEAWGLVPSREEVVVLG